MTSEGWAMLWIGGINLVWASVFFGVLVFALRTDTEAGHRDHRGPGRGPESPPTPGPRGAGHPGEHAGRRRLRGAERAAARRRTSRSGTTYYPRPVR